MSTSAALSKRPNPPETKTGPAIRGESEFDRVTSLLLAVILGAVLIFGWLILIYATNQAYQSRVTAPLEIVEVSGGGGGSPDGQVGGIETVQVPGGPAGDKASNNEEEAGDFEEVAAEATPAAMLDTVAEAGQAMAEVDIGAVVPSGGRVASGKRQSKIGNGSVGYGFGPGDGGVRREDRWSIVFNQGQTAEEYAAQLDGLKVELAVISNGQMLYVSRFSDAQPTKRVGSGQGDNRLYFIWRGQGRKGSDVALLRKAGVEVGDGVIFQFFPPGAENQLAQLEGRYKGRTPAEIRRTQFRVIPAGESYTFEVASQEPLR
jgi:hypothetical protein